MAQTQQLSQAAFDRLQAEHGDLTTRGRIEIAQAIERARELGDLSENGDYHAAKDQQGLMEDRIRHLESILENAEIVADTPEGVVGVGSLVTILYEGDDDDMAETYLVDSVEQRRDGIEVISPQSPLGESLIGSREGATVAYSAPNGELRVRIVSVRQG
jgi:transcription elongation factor GreA